MNIVSEATEGFVMAKDIWDGNVLIVTDFFIFIGYKKEPQLFCSKTMSILFSRN